MTATDKVAVFYYTQTGQSLAIARQVCAPLAAAGATIIYKEIVPETAYPFPWSADAFFQVFPESRLGIGCPLRPIDLSDVQDATLVVLAGQSWYLSLSTPLHAFFQSADIQAYLKGRRIVTIDGCRNMWAMKQLKTREYIHHIGGRYVGAIVLQDPTPNLISVITIVRWLLHGKKGATRWLPAAGVPAGEIAQADRFGTLLLDALRNNRFDRLQQRLADSGAIRFVPTLYFIEKNGYRLWGAWARFILKKAPHPGKTRRPYLRLFMYYLFFVLYVVSPFGLLFFWLTRPFRSASLRRARHEMCHELGWNHPSAILQ